MQTYTYTKQLTVKKSYDVIVCGGGVAGVAAAVSAANNGLSTLLLEKSNILGGLGTLGLINLFVPMCNGRGKQIIFGLAEELLRVSALYGFSTIPEEWKTGSFKGLTARGGFTVDAVWKDGKVFDITVVSNAGERLKIKTSDGFIEQDTEKGKIYKFTF